MAVKQKIFVGIFFLLSLLPALLYGQAYSKQWQEAKSINSGFKAIASQPDIEVFSAPNEIMLKVNRSVEVRLFTILGKLISEQQLQPGIFQYHLDAHGIYVIKTDENSFKVAI